MKLAFIFLSFAVPLLRAAPTEADYFISLSGWESFCLTPYNDGAHKSVGLGHNLSAHKEALKPSYTQIELMTFFRSDLATSLRAARAGVRDFDDLPDEVQLAVVGLIWTVGPTGFFKFKNLRLALSMRAFDGAASELWDSKWRTQISMERFNYYFNVLKSQ